MCLPEHNIILIYKTASERDNNINPHWALLAAHVTSLESTESNDNKVIISPTWSFWPSPFWYSPILWRCPDLSSCKIDILMYYSLISTLVWCQQTRIRSSHSQEDGTNSCSPEKSTRDPASRKTTKGKATTSLGRRYTEMVQWDWDPDDRSQQLGEGPTSDCISTRRRWQKSSTKVK